MEHVLAEDPASPKLLGILKNQLMHELSFSARLIKCDFGNTKGWENMIYNLCGISYIDHSTLIFQKEKKKGGNL
jgi:hypothetical protein